MNDPCADLVRQYRNAPHGYRALALRRLQAARKAALEIEVLDEKHPTDLLSQMDSEVGPPESLFPRARVTG